MSDISSDTQTAASGMIDRRGLMKRVGAASVGAVAATGMASAAAATVLGPKLHSYKGRYAIDSHRIVSGLFVSPAGDTPLDVVVLVSRSGALDSATAAAAQRYAAAGWLAIAPDLPATYRGAAIGGKGAMVAALNSDLPRFKRLSRSSGRVTVVNA